MRQRSRRGLPGGWLLLLGLLALSASAAPPRKIYGHYMGCFCAGTGAIQYHATTGLAAMDAPQALRGGDPLTRDIAGWATKTFGGTYRNFALAPYGRTLKLEEAAELEIRRAMRIGLDGFTFDAWAGGAGAMKLFDAMFAVCEAKDYPFELTLTLDTTCLDAKMPEFAPYEGNQWVKAVKWLLDRHGQSPKLARREGKPLIMGYQSIWPAYGRLQEEAARRVGGEDKAKLKAEVDRLRSCAEGWRLIGEAYRRLETEIGQPIYWEFCLSAFFHNVNPAPPRDAIVQAAACLARDFPAVGLFMWEGPVPEIARAVLDAGAEWSHPMKLQYENYGYFQAASPGLDWIRGDWERARELPSTLIQQITWNDYHENTNLSPGYNTRYAYYDLTGQFIRWWKTGQQPSSDHDRVYLFSHKYAHGTPMYPFQAKTRADNEIEVLTILPRPATLRCPGRRTVDGRESWEAPAGMSFQRLPLTPGPVSVELLRGGRVELTLESPEPVSDRPFRQDTGKVAISTECRRLWAEDFGPDEPFFAYSEYGDADGDGLPNWFEMLWFGKFGDPASYDTVKPDDDPDRDGKTNIEEYLAQTDPTKP